MATAAVDELSFLEEAVQATGDLIMDVHARQWKSQTACEAMDVGTLVAHLVGGLEQFSAIPAAGPDRASGQPSPPAPPSLQPDEAAAAYVNAGEQMVDAWSLPGAVERAYPMPWGETPGVTLVGFMVIEQVTHGWDLTQATGQAVPFGDELVEHTLTMARSFDDASIRVPGMFGPIVEIAPDAPAIDRLAAFLGRHPSLANPTVGGGTDRLPAG
jgi:uncharacterized protein (TIGR03086 family)